MAIRGHGPRYFRPSQATLWWIGACVFMFVTTQTQGQLFQLWRGGDNDGLLQVWTKGAWYLACSQSTAFSTKEGNVLCRGLSKPSGHARLTDYNGYFVGNETLAEVIGEMKGSAIDFRCFGNETSFSQCSVSVGEPKNDSCLLAIGVYCSSTAPDFLGSPLQPQQPQQPQQRLVEVNVNSSWNAVHVCANDFGVKEANVTCKTLGENWTDARPLKLRNKLSTDPLVGGMRCFGNEGSLADCSFVLGFTGCPNRTEAAVVCENATDLKFRLMNGMSVSSGRVEVWHKERWGTVCGRGLGKAEGRAAARVICRSLGLEYKSARVVQLAEFGAGEGVIWLKDINCTGSEENLFQCDRHFDGTPVGEPCSHLEDLAISCESHRLHGQGDTDSGLIQVFQERTWINVTGDNFDKRTATVGCRAVGKPRSGLSYAVIPAPDSEVDDMLHVKSCVGSEDTLLDCMTEWVDPVELREQGADVTQVQLTCQQEERPGVKFRHPGRDKMGLYEVYNGTEWGTICGNGLGDTEARVACRHLGLGSSFAAVFDASLTDKGNGSVLLDGLSCTGRENSLSQCDHNPFGVVTCQATHTDDLNLYCGEEEDNFQVRLVGDQDNGGRVEVRLYGSWGTVCETGFDYRAAAVICRQLNLPMSEPRTTSIFPPGVGRVWLHGVNCTGEELSIKECRRNPVRSPAECTHQEDVGVVCSGTVVAVDEDLSGGAIAGITIAVLLLFVLLGLGLCIGIRRWSAARRDLRSNLLKTEPNGRAEYDRENGVVNVAFNDSPKASRGVRIVGSSYSDQIMPSGGYGRYEGTDDDQVPPPYHTLDLNGGPSPGAKEPLPPSSYRGQAEGADYTDNRPFHGHTPKARGSRQSNGETEDDNFGFSSSSRGRETAARKEIPPSTDSRVTGRHGRPPYSGGVDNPDYNLIRSAPEYQPRSDDDYHPRTPTEYHPRSPADYHPRSPSDHHPRSPADYHPRSPADYHPRSPADYHPRSPANYHPRSPANGGDPPSAGYREPPRRYHENTKPELPNNRQDDPAPAYGQLHISEGTSV